MERGRNDRKDDDEKRNRKTKSKKRIEIEYIENKTKRQTSFSKRRDGIMKKAFEMHKLTGAEVLMIVVSESAHIYTFGTKKFEPFIKEMKEVGGLNQFVPHRLRGVKK